MVFGAVKKKENRRDPQLIKTEPEDRLFDEEEIKIHNFSISRGKDLYHQPIISNMQSENLVVSDKNDEDSQEDLGKLSFWYQPFPPGMGFDIGPDKRNFFRISSVVFALFLMTFFIWWLCKIIGLDSVDEIPAVIKAPATPYKINPPLADNVEPNPIYEKFEENTKQKKDLLMTESDQDISPNVVKKPNETPVIKTKTHDTKVKIHQKVIAPEPRIVKEENYYIHLGTFASHYNAGQYWQNLKANYYNNLKNLDPIIRIIPGKTGKKYELLTGPVTRKNGTKKCQDLGGEAKLFGFND